MNCVQLVGRLTRDPDVKYTNDGTSIVRFGIAVDRRFKKEGGQTADFPNIVAFGKTAEFIEKYFHKGMRIGLMGRIQTGSYDHKDGYTVYTTDVIAENVEFVESKQQQEENTQAPATESSVGNGFMDIPEGIDEELPFN